MESLTFKLKKQQKHIKQTSLKSKPTLLLDTKEIQQIAMHLPKDTAALSTLIGADKTSAYGNEIISITTKHPRDQTALLECVLEMQAFVRGGDTGIHVLNPVYTRILAHYNMMTEINEIFDILDLCTHKLTGKLKRKYHKIADDDDEEMTFQWARKSSAFQ